MEQNRPLWRLGGPERFECRMCRLQIPNNPHADSEGGGLAIYLILRAVAQNPSIYLILGTTPPPTGASAGVSATLSGDNVNIV